MVKVLASSEDFVLELFAQVVTKKVTMVDAERGLLEYVNSLSEEKQIEFRAKGRTFGMHLMSVSEGFLQQLTVISAGR